MRSLACEDRGEGVGAGIFFIAWETLEKKNPLKYLNQFLAVLGL